MRTIIEMPDKQLQALARFCALENISRAEAVRRAVDQLLAMSPAGGRDAGFGIWKHKHLASRKLVDKLRSEWGGP